MRYYVIPCLKDKQEAKELVETLKEQTTQLLDDDLIVGYFGFENQDLVNQINNIFHFYTIKLIDISNNYKELLNQSFQNIKNSNLDNKLKLSIWLTLLLKLGLTVQLVIKNKDEEINQIFFTYSFEKITNFNDWLDHLVLLEDYYDPLTSYPYNKKSLLTIDNFKKTQELIFNIL